MFLSMDEVIKHENRLLNDCCHIDVMSNRMNVISCVVDYRPMQTDLCYVNHLIQVHESFCDPWHKLIESNEQQELFESA